MLEIIFYKMYNIFIENPHKLSQPISNLIYNMYKCMSRSEL